MQRRLALLLPVLLLVPPRARADDLAARLATHRTIVCAHRGWLAPDRPENSLRTMRETEGRGRFMLEMDLAVSGDRRIVMMHDATVDRTTDGTGRVAELDAAARLGLHLRPQGGPPTTEIPPLFDDVLDWAATSPSALLMLDIKRSPPAQVMARVRRERLGNRVLLLTFDRPTAEAAFAADPAVLVSVLVGSRADLDFYASRAGRRRFAAYVPLDRPPSLFDAARARGAVVITDLLDLRDALTERYDVSALRARPVDIVVTNHPAETASRLSSRQADRARSRPLPPPG